MPILEDGQLFERYRIRRWLGSGIAGESYEAEDRILQRKVTLKLIHPWTTLPDSARRQFFREMQGISLLNHLYLATVLDYGEVDGRIYVARRYVSSGSLLSTNGRLWYHPPLPIADAFKYTHQLAQVLHYIHQHGYLHGSLTFANVLVLRGPNTEQSADYAPFLLADVGLTNFVRRFGNPRLEMLPVSAAPEQLGKRVTPASDQFALAVLLYFWLAGRPPYLGTSDEIEQQKLSETMTPLSILNPDITQEQDSLILRALTVYPDERHASMLAFAEALMASLASPVRQHTAPFPLPPEKPRELSPVPQDEAPTTPESEVQEHTQPITEVSLSRQESAPAEYSPSALEQLLTLNSTRYAAPAEIDHEAPSEESQSIQIDETLSFPALPETPRGEEIPAEDAPQSADLHELAESQPAHPQNVAATVASEDLQSNEPIPEKSADLPANTEFSTLDELPEMLPEQVDFLPLDEPPPALQEAVPPDETPLTHEESKPTVPLAEPTVPGEATFIPADSTPSSGESAPPAASDEPSSILATATPTGPLETFSTTDDSSEVDLLAEESPAAHEAPPPPSLSSEPLPDSEEATPTTLLGEPVTVSETGEDLLAFAEGTSAAPENTSTPAQAEFVEKDAAAHLLEEMAGELASAEAATISLPECELPPQAQTHPSIQEARETINETYPPIDEAIVAPRLLISSPYTSSCYEYPLLNEETNIGRAGASDLYLEQDNLTSRHHALLKRVGERVLIFDKRSHNGVFINGQKIDVGRGYELADGDHIGIGNYELIFRVSSDNISQLI